MAGQPGGPQAPDVEAIEVGAAGEVVQQVRVRFLRVEEVPPQMKPSPAKAPVRAKYAATSLEL